MPAACGEADVVSAEAECSGSRCRFSVTVAHADTGWDHYADHWRILAPDGTELGRRVLLHPHVGEQPFTRRLDGVEVPENLTEIMIEAHDSRHDYGGAVIRVTLPGRVAG